MHKAKWEKPNPKLIGRGEKKSEREVHERWDTDGHNSVMKKVQLLLKACLSSVVNMVEPILKTSIVY